MAYKSSADGIAKKGKTEGHNLGDTGPSVGIKKGPIHAGSRGGKTNADMKSMGRGLAKIAAQKKG
jgi:hypothetical protein